MAISNELSSEIASAILAERKSPQERERLKEVILKVHSALQEMSEPDRSRRLAATTHSSETKSRKLPTVI